MAEPEYYFEWRKTASRSLLVPPIKCNTAGAVLNNDIWIFGGKGSSSEFNDIWKYSTSKLEWENIEARGTDIPPPRDGHSLTKISKTKFVIFGGQGHLLDSGVCERGTENGKVKYLAMRKLFDDMYEFDCEKLSWTLLPRRKIRPLARRGHSVVFVKPTTALKGIENHPDDELLGSSGKGHLLLFGGSCIDLSTGFERPASDVWLYCLESLSWEEVHCDGHIPLPIYGHCAELVETNLIIIGGTVLSLKSNRGPYLPSPPSSLAPAHSSLCRLTEIAQEKDSYRRHEPISDLNNRRVCLRFSPWAVSQQHHRHPQHLHHDLDPACGRPLCHFLCRS
jgi:hypothetical protein